MLTRCVNHRSALLLRFACLLLGLLALSCDEGARIPQPPDTVLDEPEGTEPESVAYEYLKIEPGRAGLWVDAVGVSAQGERSWAQEGTWLGRTEPVPVFDELLGAPDAFLDWPIDWSWCIAERSSAIPPPGVVVRLPAGIREGDSILLLEFADCIFMTDWGTGDWYVGSFGQYPFHLSIGPTADPDSGRWLRLDQDMGEGPFHRYVVPELVRFDD